MNLYVQLNNTPKRTSWLTGHRIRSEYKAKEAELDSVIEGMKGSALKIVKGFNEKNNKNIRVSMENVRRGNYSCFISMDVNSDESIYGNISPSFLTETSFERVLNLKPSDLIDSFSNLRNIERTHFKYKSKERDVKLTTNKSLGQILDELDEGESADLRLEEKTKLKPVIFSSEINFKPRVQEVEVRYKIDLSETIEKDRTLTKKRRKWLEETVNILTGSKLEQVN